MAEEDVISTSMFTTLSLFSKQLDTRTGVDGSFGYFLIVVVFLFVSFIMKLTSNNKTILDDDNEERDNGNSSKQGTTATHNPLGSREDDEPEPQRNFTLEQLSKFNGIIDERGNEPPVYMSVNTIVFDVTDGKEYYGPGGPYELFAGKECGVALAKLSFDETYINDFDTISKLNHGERCELDNWLDKFQNYRRYPIIGKVIPPNKIPNHERILTIDELSKYDGTSNDTKPDDYAATPIYLGAGSKVFDVSFGGIGFYGKGGGYHRFAGKDASRALAKMSFDDDDIQNSSISDLTDAQRKVLKDWIHTFEVRKQYPIVGRLLKEGDEVI